MKKLQQENSTRKSLALTVHKSNGAPVQLTFFGFSALNPAHSIQLYTPHSLPLSNSLFLFHCQFPCNQLM